MELGYEHCSVAFRSSTRGKIWGAFLRFGHFLFLTVAGEIEAFRCSSELGIREELNGKLLLGVVNWSTCLIVLMSLRIWVRVSAC
jgi:hypothetical protein